MIGDDYTHKNFALVMKNDRRDNDSLCLMTSALVRMQQNFYETNYLAIIQCNMYSLYARVKIKRKYSIE